MEERVKKQVDIQQKILSFMRIRGPSLPVHIAKETGLTSLLAGAFLSTLVSDKTIKISNMKVGGSPLYFLQGQEHLLENFIRFLNQKEREAFLLLKEKQVMQDDELEPAIRVALRNLKDFAHPFSINNLPNTILWRFFSFSEQEAKNKIESALPAKLEIKVEEKEEPKVQPLIKIEENQETKPEIKLEIKVEDIKTKQETLIKSLEPIFPEKIEKSRRERSKPDKFLAEVKVYLKSKDIDLTHVEKFDKKEVLGKIILSSKKACFLMALDKKRIEEDDLLKANRKSQALGLPYIILAKGEISKKLKESIEAFKSLEKIEKM